MFVFNLWSILAFTCLVKSQYLYSTEILMIFGCICVILLALVLHCQKILDQVSLPKNSDAFIGIPHDLYVYWNKPINLAPTFTQFCLNAMKKTAQTSKWNFILLNNENLNNYLSEESKNQLEFIANKKQSISTTSNADLIRLFVLRDNGGIWMDSNSFFVQNLSWIDDIANQEAAYNKLSSYPEMIMYAFSQNYGGNRTVVFDERTKKNIILFPGYQIWTLIAKPNAKFLNAIIDSIIGMYRAGTEEQFVQQNAKQGFQYLGEDNLYFVYSNYQFQTVLQKKQREIQSNPSGFKEKYAVEYYNIWTMEASRTGFRIIQKNKWIFDLLMKDLYYSSLDQIRLEKDDPIYFMKFTSHFYRDISEFIESLQGLNCVQAIEPIRENSVLNEFLFKPNEETELVKRLREVERRRKDGQEMNCDIIKKNTSIIIKVVLLVSFMLIIGLFSLCFCCLRKLNKKRHKKELVEQID